MKYEEFKKYINHADDMERWQAESAEGVFSYGQIKPKIFYRIISIKYNEDVLQRCPHIRFFDTAITFRWLFHQDSNGISSALIEYKHLEYWEIGEEELIRAAVFNTPRLFPLKRCRILDVLRQWVDLGGPNLPLYVMTNTMGINGAATLFYPGALKAFADEIAGDFYILPSSIHEILLIGTKEVKFPQDLYEMVREANQTVVSKSEFLSDQVFYYDRERRKLSLLDHVEKEESL